MAIPVISTTTSVLGYRKGQYFEYQMQATNSPTSWTANGLPSGMSISSAGLVSGAATAAGVYLVTVIATNSTGPSLPLEVAMGIEDSNYNDGLGIEVNIDLRSGAVAVPGITPSSTGSQAALFMKYGDKMFLDLGFFKGEALQSMAMSSAILNIREFDGETVLVQSNGSIENVGTNDKPRYRILVDLKQPNLLNALGNYAGDFQTTFDAVAEIEWRVDYLEPGALANEIVRSSKTFRIAIDRDLVPNP
ncbi:MAG: Ig domain-containing protein [Akkermansiaceae bacterium]|nr:Ig domain-containing protein [Akkermansiaceae bacterium]